MSVFRRLQFRRRETFDSSATPQIGKRVVTPKVVAEIDLAALGEEIKATVEKAKADDPRELRRRIAELEKQLAARPKEQVEVEKIVEVPVLKNGQLDRTEKIAERLQAFADKFTAETQELRRLITAAATPRPLPAPRPAVAPKPAVAQKPLAPRAPAPRAAAKKINDDASPSGLSRCERAILAVLAQHGAGCTAGKLTLLAGYRYSGGVKNALSNLRTAGYIVGANTEVMRANDDLFN